jgi:hypothetical protein
MSKTKTVRPVLCPSCDWELVVGLSNRYLMRCSNFLECGRYVLRGDS